MLILIDGYNVIAPVAPPGRGASSNWLQHERQRLIERLAVGLGSELARETTVVFDAACVIAGAESKFVKHGIEILFAVNYPEADDLIEELISQNTTPKKLTVVSSDHRIHAAARRRGALAVDSDLWLDRLEAHQPLLAATVRRAPSGPDVEPPPSTPDPSDVAAWLQEFGFSADGANTDSAPTDSVSDQALPKSPDVYNPFPPGYGDDLLR